jgi:hypothetical protein
MNDNDNDMVVFRVFPSGMTTDEAKTANDKLWAEHEAEAERHGAEFYNYGAFQDEHAAFSKTSRGGLSSRINPTTLEVRHFWEP